MLIKKIQLNGNYKLPIFIFIIIILKIKKLKFFLTKNRNIKKLRIKYRFITPIILKVNKKNNNSHNNKYK